MKSKPGINIREEARKSLIDNDIKIRQTRGNSSAVNVVIKGDSFRINNRPESKKPIVETGEAFYANKELHSTISPC